MNQIRHTVGHSDSGGFGNYQVPASNEYGALSQINELTLAVSDSATLFNLSGVNLGFDLSDVNAEYFELAWNSGAIFVTGGDVAGRQAVFLREGSTASSVAGGGTLFTNSVIQHSTTTGIIQYIGSFFGSSRPSAGLDSEFGVHASDTSTTASRSRVHGATLLVLPLTATSFSGATLGAVNNTWGAPNPGSLTVGTPGADTDQTISATFSVAKAGTYLVLTRVRVQSGAAGAARSMRWAQLMNNVDMFAVKTNTATAGATRTGRGFQWQLPAVATIQPYLTSAQVVTLPAGTNTYSVVGNRHESANNTEIFANNVAFIVNTMMFRQFKYVNVTATQTALTSANWAAHAAFTQTIAIDGTAKLWLIFNTSSHQNTQSGVLSIRIKRNGTVITPFGADAGSQNYPQFGGYAVLNGTNGAADSDNDTLPYCIHWIDNPGAGTWTYTIESADQGSTSNALWNSNDNGAAGFIGMFAIAELALARSF